MGKLVKMLIGIFLVVITISSLLYIVVRAIYTADKQQSFSEAASITQKSPFPRQNTALTYRIVHEGLQIPWDTAFLPNGTLLVTERREH